MANLTCVRTDTGALAPALVINKEVYARVERFLAWEMEEFYLDERRCVRPAYDHLQSVPIIRTSREAAQRPGLMFISLLTLGLLFPPRRVPFYQANSVGLRLIAEAGSPELAFARLGA